MLHLQIVIRTPLHPGMHCKFSLFIRSCFYWSYVHCLPILKVEYSLALKLVYFLMKLGIRALFCSLEFLKALCYMFCVNREFFFGFIM